MTPRILSTSNPTARLFGGRIEPIDPQEEKTLAELRRRRGHEPMVRQ
jgi:hypothetical protein